MSSRSRQDLDLSNPAGQNEIVDGPMMGDRYRDLNPHATRRCDLGLPSADHGPSGHDPELDARCRRAVDRGEAGGSPKFGGERPGMSQSISMRIGLLDDHHQRKDTEEISGILPAEEFDASHIPQFRPTDPFFRLAITTMYACSSKPHEIGNTLLKFLATQVSSHILKVKRCKFAIKAEVIVGNLMCQMKIRVYDEGKDAYAIEFQRRSGDTSAFNGAYQRAAQFVLPQFTDMETMSTAEAGAKFPPLLQPLKNSAEDGEVAELQGGFQPLLDLAVQAELPELQAESASGLADIAKDEQQGRLLCTTEAFREFKRLLTNDRTDVSYSTACLLQSLAKYPEAPRCFAGGDVLSMILQKIRAKETPTLVQRKLVQVLNAAIPRCAVYLTENVSKGLMEALQGPIQDGGNTARANQDQQEAQ